MTHLTNNLIFYGLHSEDRQKWRTLTEAPCATGHSAGLWVLEKKEKKTTETTS